MKESSNHVHEYRRGRGNVDVCVCGQFRFNEKAGPAIVESTAPKRMSHKRMTALGWARVDPRPWTKTRARWRHWYGWTLVHCGHPTALRPWTLYNPAGAPVWRNGRAWSSLTEAAAHVEVAMGIGVCAHCGQSMQHGYIEHIITAHDGVEFPEDAG